MRYVFSVLTLLALLTTPSSATEGYDKLKQAFASQSAPTHAELYSQRIERSFLESGISMSVWKKGESLIIFGYMSKALVYQTITRLGVLKDAKAAGFKRVIFSPKGSGGDYVYDLSGGELPRCDKVGKLCLH